MTYDGDDTSKGKLSSITDTYGSESFTYDSLGRLLTDSRTINTVSTSTRYSYDATTGDLASMTYPSGMVVGYAYGHLEKLPIRSTSSL